MILVCVQHVWVCKVTGAAVFRRYYWRTAAFVLKKGGLIRVYQRKRSELLKIAGRKVFGYKPQARIEKMSVLSKDMSDRNGVYEKMSDLR